MNEQRRAIMISTGMDNLPLLAKLKENETFVGSSLDRVSALYAKLSAKKAAIESAENDASLARLAKNMAAKEAMNKAWMEKQTAMAVIAGGSGGYGSGFVTAEQRAAGVAEEVAAGSAAGSMARGAREVSKEAHGLAGIMRETAVLFREGFRGNFTRMIGSFTILAGMISSYAIPVVASVAAIAEFLPRLWGGATISGTMKAYKEKDQSELDVKQRTDDATDMLRQRVELLKKAGLIDAKKAGDYSFALKRPELSTVDLIMGETNKLLPKGGQSALADLVEKQRLDAAHFKNISAINRDELSTSERLQYDQARQLDQKKQMALLDRDSVDYKKRQLDLDDTSRLIQKDMVDLQKEKTEAAAKEARTKAEETVKNFMQGSEYPSLETLAGRGYSQNLNKLYGAGGRFDLGSGNGPFAGIARDALLAQKQQSWDRIHGNIWQADQDRKRYNVDVDHLVRVGAASPQQLLTQILNMTTKSAASQTFLVEMLINGTAAIQIPSK